MNELEIIKNALPKTEEFVVEYDEDDDEDVVIFHTKYYSNDEKQAMKKEIKKALAFAGLSTFVFFERK